MQDNRTASTQQSLDHRAKGDVLPVGGVPDGTAARREHPQSSVSRMRRGGALRGLGQDFDDVLACEGEPGLGNGGLGRLAACYLDSLATLEPAIGYGIRYEFGIFDQEIRDGWQVEKTDNWLTDGNPWEIASPDVNTVNWAATPSVTRRRRHDRVRWIPERVLKGVAYDTPIQGYGVHTCNVLTLWTARAVESFALEAFNTGDYYRAVVDEVSSETVTKVLYPNDEPEQGKRLRLLQQYFFVSCSLQHVLHIMDDLAGASCTSCRSGSRCSSTTPTPSIGVAELMRLLVDERRVDWDEAWDDHRRDVRLHQPHAAARGAGNVAAGDVRRVAAPPPRDHLRDQPALPRRGARDVPRRRRAVAAHVADRRGRRQERAHGVPGHGRQPRDQRSRRAALRTAQGERAAGFLRAVAGTVLQQDQRCDAAALPGAVATPACAHCSTAPSATAGSPTSIDSVAWKRSRTTPGSSGSGERSSAPTRPGSRSTSTPPPASS